MISDEWEAVPDPMGLGRGWTAVRQCEDERGPFEEWCGEFFRQPMPPAGSRRAPGFRSRLTTTRSTTWHEQELPLTGHTVADALAGEGQQPTIRAVRERLGDTGSPNTIHKHLSSTWREAARWPLPLRRNRRRR